MAFDSLGVGCSVWWVRRAGWLPESGYDWGLGTRGSGPGEAPARRGRSPPCHPAPPALLPGSPPSGCRGPPISRILSGWWVLWRLPGRHRNVHEKPGRLVMSCSTARGGKWHFITAEQFTLLGTSPTLSSQWPGKWAAVPKGWWGAVGLTSPGSSLRWSYTLGCQRSRKRNNKKQIMTVLWRGT